MSYVALPTSVSRSTSPASEVSLLPTHSSDSIETTCKYEDVSNAWDPTKPKERQHRRRQLVFAILVPLVVVSLIGFAYAANENDRVVVPGWIRGHFAKTESTVKTLLVPRLEPDNGTYFTYYPDPLTNPVSPQWRLDFDDKLTIESLPSNVSTLEPSSIVFNCAHSNLTYCAQAYRVVFMGPTMHSPAWSDSTQLDERRVRVEFRLTDPGEYQIYAWPEHDQCNPFQPELHDWKIRPYFKLAVTGTPATITVGGPAAIDGTRECTLEDDMADGRWISRKHLNPEHLDVESPLYTWVQSHLDPARTRIKTLTDYRKYHYIFANFKCKLRHRTFEEYVDEIKPNQLLFLGDSITRDQMCMNYGTANQTFGICKFGRWDNPYSTTEKNVPLVRTSDNGTTMISFHWEPLGDPVDTEKYLASLAEPPSHIFFEIGLWLTERDTSPEAFVNGTRRFVEALTRLAPHSKLMTRTTASAVQPIACYDKRNIQRRVLEPVNEAFLSFMREEYPQVTVLDSYKVYDDRPDASEDGRHWERVEEDEKWSKAEEGAVTYAMTDIIFETWRLQGLRGDRESTRRGR